MTQSSPPPEPDPHRSSRRWRSSVAPSTACSSESASSSSWSSWSPEGSSPGAPTSPRTTSTTSCRSQNIAFPPAAALEEEGRTDLLPFAGHAVNTGPEAEAYASFINGHLEGIADGATFADLGDTERAANTAVETATADGASAAQIAELQGEADAITGQRNSLFKGETLRGLLLSAFAWSTVGRIAGIAAIAAFAAAGVMLVLVALGLRHHHKVVVQTR